MSTEHDGRRYHYAIAPQVQRDQVAAALRDQPRPATAKEIGSSLSVVMFETCAGDHEARAALWDGSRWFRHVADGLDVCGYQGHLGTGIQKDLDALAKAGLATRQKKEGSRSVLWTWVGDPVDMDGIEDFRPDDASGEEV